MLNAIETINTAVNNFIWGVPAMVCIIGVGLYLSIRTGFLQIRKFPLQCEMDFRGGGMFERIAGSLLNDAVDVQAISFRKYRPVTFFGKHGAEVIRSA